MPNLRPPAPIPSTGPELDGSPLGPVTSAEIDATTIQTLPAVVAAMFTRGVAPEVLNTTTPGVYVDGVLVAPADENSAPVPEATDATT